MGFFKWIVISLMCLYFGFMVGKFKQDILHHSIQLLTLDVASLNKENAELLQKLMFIQTDFAAEKKVNKAVVLENERLNEALNTSRKQLYFYEQVVASELTLTGLNVYSFKVSKSEGGNDWLYELILIQGQQNRRLLKGNVDIMFVRSDGTEATLISVKLSDLDESFKSTFEFKYFQTITGQFTLPEGSVFDQVFVVAHTVGNRWYKSQSIEKRYDWKHFIAVGDSELKELAVKAKDE